MEKRSFWMGLLLGVGVTLASVAGMLGGARATGVTITMDRELVERAVAQEVERSVRQELPALLAQVERDAPPKVAAAVGQRLDSVTVNFGWGEVQMPAEIKGQVASRVAEAVTAGLKAGLQAVPTEQIAQRVAAGAPAVADRLVDGLGAQRISVRIAGLAIPLRIRAI